MNSDCHGVDDRFGLIDRRRSGLFRGIRGLRSCCVDARPLDRGRRRPRVSSGELRSTIDCGTVRELDELPHDSTIEIASGLASDVDHATRPDADPPAARSSGGPGSRPAPARSRRRGVGRRPGRPRPPDPDAVLARLSRATSGSSRASSPTRGGGRRTSRRWPRGRRRSADHRRLRRLAGVARAGLRPGGRRPLRGPRGGEHRQRRRARS